MISHRFVGVVGVGLLLLTLFVSRTVRADFPAHRASSVAPPYVDGWETLAQARSMNAAFVGMVIASNPGCNAAVAGSVTMMAERFSTGRIMSGTYG